MAEITKRETRNRGERRPVVQAPATAASATPATPRVTTSDSHRKSLKRKSPEAAPVPEPAKPRDPPGLPSSRSRQESDLPDNEWQSISESGVLTASLKQSVEKWRDGGCFEKYWVKNPKKKAHGDFQNPTTAMARIGSAVLTIEPHAFEINLYATKVAGQKGTGTTHKTSSSFTQPIPAYKHSTQALPVLQPGPILPKVAAPVASMGSKPSGSGKSTNQGQPGSTQPAQESPSVRSIQPNKPLPAGNGPSDGQQPSTTPNNTNPVIRELALRASADSGLKDLMKNVAQGAASEAQLKEFQRHIDEINAMLREQSRKASTPKNPPSAPNKTPNAGNVRYIQPMEWNATDASKIKKEPGTISTKPLIQPIPDFKQPPPPRPEVTTVVFDIVGGTGDRYLIPRKSLLEYNEGGRVAIMSFLVHLKGLNAAGGLYENNKEYCELITFKLKADVPEILESLRRAIDPTEVVQKQMLEWADKMTVAEKAYLVLRLRRQSEAEEQPVPQPGIAVKEELSKTDFEAPNSLFPVHKRVETICL